MTSDREGKVAGIKQQIERGHYQVDPRAVADAILRRLNERWTVPEVGDPYNKCSYPESSGSDSPNVRPAP
jgi:hypothetical protein